MLRNKKCAAPFDIACLNVYDSILYLSLKYLFNIPIEKTAQIFYNIFRQIFTMDHSGLAAVSETYRK